MIGLFDVKWCVEDNGIFLGGYLHKPETVMRNYSVFSFKLQYFITIAQFSLETLEDVC